MTPCNKRIWTLNLVLADQSLVSGVNFLTSLILARTLTVEEYGSFSLIWIFVILSVSIQQALIISPMMSLYPKYNSQQQFNYLGLVTLYQVAVALIMALVATILSYSVSFIYPEALDKRIVYLIGILIFSMQMQEVIRRIGFVRKQPSVALMSDIVNYLGRILAIYFYYNKSNNIDLVSTILLITIVTTLSVVIGAFNLRYLNFDKYNRKVYVLEHWSNAKWLVRSVVFQWFSGNFYFVLVALLLSREEVGGLRATQNILAFLNIIFQGLENYVPMTASRIKHLLGTERMYKYIWRVIKFGVLAVALFSVTAVMFSQELLNVFYGDKYDNYQYLIKWWGIVYIFMYLGFPLRAAIRAVDKTILIYRSYVTAAVATLIIGPVLINLFTSAGAIISLGIMYLIITAILIKGAVNRAEVERVV